MNKDTIKVIRKWSIYRSLPYKIGKHLYEKQTEENKEKMMDEMTNYITAVEMGRITPSRPKKDQTISSEAKTTL